jgi:hypothetical protein
MINIIYKILTANNGEQHEDNNNDNAINYPEFNKDSLLYLAEKHYENLVETLTINVINAAGASSSSSPNPSSSLPQSSSPICQNLSNQSDIYKIEESETFHYNSIADIAD